MRCRWGSFLTGSSLQYTSQPHFTDRSTKSVRDKWNKSLDPAYVQGKWSQQEDNLLRTVVNKLLEQAERKHQSLESSAGGGGGKGNSSTHDGEADQAASTYTKSSKPIIISWAQVSRDHFPDRRAEQLCARWTQNVATEEQLMQKVRFGLAQECANRGHVILQGNTNADDIVSDTAGEASKQQEGNVGTNAGQQPLGETADDGFVLQLVPKAGSKGRKKRRKVAK